MPRGVATARALIGCLLLLVGCARVEPGLPSPAGTPVLTVVAWNMHAGEGDLARLLDELRAGRHGPAGDYVLLLQEAVVAPETGAVEAAARTRGLSVFFDPVREGEARVSGNAILSTRPLTGAHGIDLPEERQPRGAAVAFIELAGVRLFVASVHLENRLALRQGLFGDRARGRQAAALVEALPAGAGILGGDLNTMLGPQEPAWQTLRARFPDTPAGASAPTFGDRLVLDHLFFELPEGWTASRRVLEEEYGSDHLPVVGVVYAPSP